MCNFYDWLDIPSISSFSSVDDTTAIGVDTYYKGLQRKKSQINYQTDFKAFSAFVPRLDPSFQTPPADHIFACNERAVYQVPTTSSSSFSSAFTGRTPPSVFTKATAGILTPGKNLLLWRGSKKMEDRKKGMVPSSSSAHSTLLGHSWGRKKPILPECGKGSRGGISCARKKTFVKKYFFLFLFQVREETHVTFPRRERTEKL